MPRGHLYATLLSPWSRKKRARSGVVLVVVSRATMRRNFSVACAFPIRERSRKVLSARANLVSGIGLAFLMGALVSCLIPAIPAEPLATNLKHPTCATSIAAGVDDELWATGCQPLDYGPLGANYAIFHRRNE